MTAESARPIANKLRRLKTLPATPVINEVDRSAMYDALMLGFPELRIVHGKGDGILRTLVRNHLRGYKQVAHMADEHADRDGANVTAVTMN